MFGDLLGNMEEQQALIKEKLAGILVEEKVDGVTVIGNGNRQITNIIIEETMLNAENKDEIEDLLITCINRFLEQSQLIEATETQNCFQSMLPPEFSDLIK